MIRVLLVGCGKSKLDRPAPARELYTGSLFRAARGYAEASGLPWRILSAEHGLLEPSQVIEPYDRHMRSRLPAPFGPPEAVERRQLRWGREEGAGRQWVDTGRTERVHDWRTPWWWSGLRASLHSWLFAPTMAGRWQPDDALSLGRDAHVAVDVHAGRLYADAMAVASRDFTNVQVSAPLAGLVLGRRLAWYAGADRACAGEDGGVMNCDGWVAMRTLTLFQGAGLADAGLSAAGCEHVLGVEWDEDAAEASRRNGLPCVTGDVRDLSLYADTGRIDLLWSSFPCQDFSTAGNRAGAKGDRNGWPWTIEVVDHLRARGDGPRWLIAENVRGLTMHVGDCPTREGGEQDDPEACPRCFLDGVIVPQLRARFAWAAWRIIDSADHGVPQRRRRVYLVAGPGPIEWPERTHSGEALAKAKWDTGDYWEQFSKLEPGPVGKPSAQEQRWLDELRQPGLFRSERPAFGLKPWVTVRQALGLGGVMDASRNTAAHPTQERPTSTDEPCFAVGGKGNQYVTESRNGRLRIEYPLKDPKSIRGPSDLVRRHPLEHPDLPGSTVTGNTPLFTVIGGGAGNAGPFVVGFAERNSGQRGLSGRSLDEPSPSVLAGSHRDNGLRLLLAMERGRSGTGGAAGTRAGTEPERLDRPAPAVTTTDAKGTRGDNMAGGPDRASDAVWLATGRRRLTVEECAALMGAPDSWVFHGTKSARYRQVGNGCTPEPVRRLAEAVARADRGER